MTITLKAFPTPTGTFTMMMVSLHDTIPLDGAPPSVTEDGVLPKPVPLMVTESPAFPRVGVMPLTVGSARKISVLLSKIKGIRIRTLECE